MNSRVKDLPRIVCFSTFTNGTPCLTTHRPYVQHRASASKQKKRRKRPSLKPPPTPALKSPRGTLRPLRKHYPHPPRLYDADIILRRRPISYGQDTSVIVPLEADAFSPRQHTYTSLRRQASETENCIQEHYHEKCKGYVPSFGLRAQSSERKRNSRWLTPFQHVRVSLQMKNIVNHIVENESRFILQDRSFVEHVTQKGSSPIPTTRQTPDSPEIFEFLNLEMIEIETHTNATLPSCEASKETIESLAADQNISSKSEFFITAPFVSSNENEPSSKSNLTVKSRRLEVDTYFADAMKTNPKCFEDCEEVEKPTPILFNARLARKDSLIVQFKSFVSSREPARILEGTESDDDFALTEPERGPSIRLLIPSLSSDGKTMSVLGDYVPEIQKTVDQMVNNALGTTDDFSKKAAKLDIQSKFVKNPATDPNQNQPPTIPTLQGSSEINLSIFNELTANDIEPEPQRDTVSRSSRRKSSALRASLDARRRGSRVAVETLLNIRVPGSNPTPINSMFIHEAELRHQLEVVSEEELRKTRALAGRHVRFASPGLRTVYNYEPVILEDQVDGLSNAKTDNGLIESVEQNIMEIKMILKRLEPLMSQYDLENYRSPNLDKMMERKRSLVSPHRLTEKFSNFHKRTLLPLGKSPDRHVREMQSIHKKGKRPTFASNESLFATEDTLLQDTLLLASKLLPIKNVKNSVAALDPNREKKQILIKEIRARPKANV